MEAAIINAFRVLNLVTSGILVGVITAEHFLILPHVRRLAPRDGVTALRFFAGRAWVLGPACGATAFGAGLIVIGLWPWDSISAAAVLTVAGMVFWAGAIVVTFTRYLPVDRRFRELVTSGSVAQAPTALRGLARANALRYSFYLAGFASFAAALAA